MNGMTVNQVWTIGGGVLVAVSLLFAWFSYLCRCEEVAFESRLKFKMAASWHRLKLACVAVAGFLFGGGLSCFLIVLH